MIQIPVVIVANRSQYVFDRDTQPTGSERVKRFLLYMGVVAILVM